MPLLSPIHIAAFTSGAVLGAGSAYYYGSKSVEGVKLSASPPTPVPATNTASIPTQAPTPVNSIHNPQDVIKMGFPGPISDLMRREAYITSYDRTKRHPAWTAQHLTAESLQRDKSAPASDRKNSQFKEDNAIPDKFRARLSTYFRSGYDRGHLVPAADAKSGQNAMDQTFYLTNIAPQVGPGFNREYWAYFETFCRNLTKDFRHVYVFTLPLYLPTKEIDGKWRVKYEVLGDPFSDTPTISVPTHFGKVVMGSKDEGHRDLSLAAFVLPNQAIPEQVPLPTFLQSIEKVERDAGLMLFNDNVKSTAKELCKQVRCEAVVRKFDQFGKQIGSKN
ncbi:hypothetical protein E3P92_02800 [Wallemia ichthyophaga]|uniref:Endonuclease n=2 Tax=Wallemia ichthyophaga TaxID=245174 RepID=A0A4T0HA87_WALIC|nr:uncharacterized protein J056_002362 [Wallemia ichthyophaga EXF-994]TIA70366.1 hypothetical protein E3P91_03107 [Wallemia ichthyophaga]EOQ99237.1 hypothetical protein J056_002362 [Wallemia ichthyophaga EXF-994]TIA80688.1 hypothetical protein E3P98_02543 [Wallemia ichthyophaga]TIB10734.1 hypothetical protein E3P90_02685 [Wallemia ichthyophaga]TIB10951.1 hypothetical protein E3P93_02741 [Wallemia ichthyophaga]